MIPRNIFTIWLNDNPEIPELVKKCIDTHNLVNYTHHLITLANYKTDYQYVRDCINAKKWVKAADFLRMEYLYNHGGIYLDADMEILKNFDDMLDTQMFVGEEAQGIFSNAAVGVEKNHPLLKEYLRRVSENFKAEGDLVFEPGIRAFADLIWTQQWDVKVYPPEYFYAKEITENSKVKHYFINSWL